ncbi:hypothetical protein [Deinococcus peraridilitoris]|uniref:Uncharacterized protein n=1 Tax=Deinococcus peraridilitoris (strain DSM 19664 / LMG 22246 / CIP 109416 / KR-200) TaxID=937777 RepID=K9ZX10_DEIPD|nr:hypothetical protein [Deinococcus peraridilitoris]AFZ66091.1 hypothetical protein Deipe_0495 [Deinococcus peraridilitoris DSM 19664]
MGITPGKTKRTKAPAAGAATLERPASPEELINQMRCDILDALETTQGGDDDSRHLYMGASLSHFAEWTQGNPFTITFPPSYNTRLTRAISWLQSLKPHEYPYSRERAQGTLINAWRTYGTEETQVEHHWELIPKLWQPPEDEFGPLAQTTQIPCLPIWDDTEHGRLAEEFDVYSGLVGYLNQQLGYHLLDMDPHPEHIL